MKIKELSKEDQKYIYKTIFEDNLNIASKGFLGFKVRKLKPTKENLEKFRRQFTGHPMCGCISCMELAKNFIMETADIKEEVIKISMDEAENTEVLNGEF